MGTSEAEPTGEPLSTPRERPSTQRAANASNRVRGREGPRSRRLSASLSLSSPPPRVSGGMLSRRRPRAPAREAIRLKKPCGGEERSGPGNRGRRGERDQEERGEGEFCWPWGVFGEEGGGPSRRIECTSGLREGDADLPSERRADRRPQVARNMAGGADGIHQVLLGRELAHNHRAERPAAEPAKVRHADCHSATRPGCDVLGEVLDQHPAQDSAEPPNGAVLCGPRGTEPSVRLLPYGGRDSEGGSRGGRGHRADNFARKMASSVRTHLRCRPEDGGRPQWTC